MKRPLFTAAAAAAIFLLAVGGEALSSRPWRPVAVDFELAAPRPPARASAAGGYVSPVVRAPKRFNLVGFRWSGGEEAEIALRARKAGGSWTRWVPLVAHTEDAPDPGSPEASSRGHSTPAWVGQADEVQYRLSAPLRGLRLHFVNSTGTATPRDRARTAVRSALNRGVTAVAALTGVKAQAQAPAIVPRAAWGADQCPPRGRPAYGEVKAAFVHHTVTANEYAAEESPGIVLAICRFHRNSNGWSDIGYNFLVDKYGTLFEGRAGGIDQAVVGAQAQGYNAETTGIANLGTHEGVPQTDAALSAMARVIRWKLPLHGQPTAGTAQVTSAGGSQNRYPSGRLVTIERVSGHRDGNRTSCPGSALYAQLPELRSRVGSVGPGAASGRTKVDAAVRPKRVSYGAGPRVTGVLRSVNGTPLPGRTVLVEQLVKGRWREIGRTTSGDGGRFEASALAARKGAVRASFKGEGGLRASSSRPSVVTVRPVLEAKVSVSRARVGHALLVEGTVKPAKARLNLVVQRRVGGRNRMVSTVRLRARGGRFRGAYRLKHPGLHRLYARVGADRSNLPSTSQPLYVRAAGGTRGGGARG